MASAEDITVAVEQVIHVTLRNAIYEISAQHGIRIRSLHVSWFPENIIGQPTRFTIASLRVKTESGD